MSDTTLLHLNGTDASTTITESGSGGATWTASGNAQLDTAQKKFGTASLLLDGTGDYVSSTNTGALPASGGWTIDCWVRINSLPGSFQERVFECDSPAGWGVWLGVAKGADYGSSGYRTYLALYSADATSIIGAGYALGAKSDFTTGVWYHLALVRDDSAGAYYLYVDGVLDTTVTSGSQVNSSIDRAYVVSQTSTQFFWDGWIDEFHVADTCLYPSGTTFSVPTTEYGAPVDGTLTFTYTVPAPVLVTGFDSIILITRAPTLEATISTEGVNAFAPAPTLDATLFVGQVMTAELTAPAPEVGGTNLMVTFPLTATLTTRAPTLSSFVFSGEALTAELTAPVVLLETGMTQVDLVAPVPVLSTTLLTSALITVVAAAPVPVMVATLFNPLILTASNAAITPRLSAALSAGNVITAALAARAPRVDASMLSGEVLSAELAAIAPIMAAAGYPAYTLTAALVAPVPYMGGAVAGDLLGSDAPPQLSSPAASTYNTWVLNARKGVLTSYDFAFNSYAVFNGKVLACNSSGVVELGTQDLDGAAAITARVRTGQHDYGSSFLKRVPRIYTGGSATGDLTFRVITSEQGTRSYLLPWLHVVGTTNRRCPIGKGIKGRYFQLEIENVAGADFDVNDVIVYPVPLKRRVM